jgi:hypothetical protein
MAGLRERFLCSGIAGIVFFLFMLTLNLVELKTLATSCALLLVRFLMRNEDSTDI